VGAKLSFEPSVRISVDLEEEAFGLPWRWEGVHGS